jgi:hypothetical protein
MGAVVTLDRYLVAALSGLIVGIVLLLGAIIVRGIETTAGGIAADSSVISLRKSLQ